MTEKQINKWLRRQFSPIGWVLIGYYVLLNLLACVTMAVDLGKQALWNLATGNFLWDLDWDTIWNNGWGYIAATVTLLVLLRAWKGGSWQPAGGERKMTAFTLFAMLSFCMGAQLLNSFWITLLELIAGCFGHSLMPMLESVAGATESFSMFLYGAVFAPIGEELLFRGYVLSALRPYGKRFAVLGSAILFGVFHGNLLQTPYALVMGLVLGYLTVEHSLLWAVLLHVFNNLVLAEGLGRLVEILPAGMGDMVTFVLLGVFFVISLVILLAKRSQIRAYRREEWIDRRCVRCLFTSAGVVLLLVMMAGNTLLSL